MNLAHSGSFHHKDLFRNHGYFNTKFKIAGDYEFLLREYVQKEDLAQFASTFVIKMRSGGVSGDLKSRRLLLDEIRLARSLNNISNISIYILLWQLRIAFYTLTMKTLGEKLATRIADSYRVLIGKKPKWS